MDNSIIYLKTILYDARTFWSNLRPSIRPSSLTWGTWVTATVSPPRIQVTQILSYLPPVLLLGIRDILVRIRILSTVTFFKDAKKNIFFFFKDIILCLTKLNFLLKFCVKFYFASIISVHSSPLWEKGKIQVRTCDQRIRIREAQKHADPPDPDSVTQHCISVSMAVHNTVLHVISLKPVCSRIKHLNRDLFGIFLYFIQHCFICCLSDSTVSEDAGIESRTVATCDFGISCQTLLPLDLINSRLDLVHSLLDHIQHFTSMLIRIQDVFSSVITLKSWLFNISAFSIFRISIFFFS